MIGDRKHRLEGLIEKLRGLKAENEEEMLQAIKILKDMLITALTEILDLDSELRATRMGLDDDAHS